MTERDRAYVWLSMTDGLGPRRIARLFAMCEDVLTLIGMDKKDWAFAVGDAIAAQMADARSRVDDQAAALEQGGIRVVTRESDDYPALLSQVYDPPAALYVKGALPLAQQRMVAMVGSRQCTRYGKEAAHMLASGLACEGVCVVSGLARGVDTACHVAALDAGGPTVAVLGCGVDVIYPPENGALYERIIASGALASEYLPGAKPLSSHFPLRNRIISGMSAAVVLVEAAPGSGAMITVDYALEHGREIFAVPGNITSAKSQEPNRLLRDGCGIASCAKDILFAMGWSSHPQKTRESRAEIQLSIEETKVVSAVYDQEMSFEELMEETGFQAAELNSHLTTLQLRGIINKSPGRVFSVNRIP